ncbi:MAG: TonB family protein [Pseudomonadota bacterium]
MSYAETSGFGANAQDRVRSAAIVTAIQGSAIAALILVPVAVVTQLPEEDDPDAIQISLPKPPPSKPVVDPPRPMTRIDAPHPPKPLPVDKPVTVPPLDDFTIDPPLIGDAGNANIAGPDLGDGVGARVPLPVLVAPRRDPRYARFFQPSYPTQKLRAGIEGQVRINVLIGIDGRVKAVKQLAASDPAFWRTTERQAMRHWRFIPATRDGEPVEQWHTVTVQFTINR